MSMTWTDHVVRITRINPELITSLKFSQRNCCPVKQWNWRITGQAGHIVIAQRPGLIRIVQEDNRPIALRDDGSFHNVGGRAPHVSERAVDEMIQRRDQRREIDAQWDGRLIDTSDPWFL